MAQIAVGSGFAPIYARARLAFPDTFLGKQQPLDLVPSILDPYDPGPRLRPRPQSLNPQTYGPLSRMLTTDAQIPTCRAEIFDCTPLCLLHTHAGDMYVLGFLFVCRAVLGSLFTALFYVHLSQHTAKLAEEDRYILPIAACLLLSRRCDEAKLRLEPSTLHLRTLHPSPSPGTLYPSPFCWVPARYLMLVACFVLGAGARKPSCACSS